jgi:hypothetical protein
MRNWLLVPVFAALLWQGCAETSSGSQIEGGAEEERDTGGRPNNGGRDSGGEGDADDDDASSEDAGPTEDAGSTEDSGSPSEDAGAPTDAVSTDGSVGEDTSTGPIREAALGADPLSIFFSFVSTDPTRLTELVTLRNIGGAPLTLTRISIDPPGIGFQTDILPSDFVLEAGLSYELGVGYQPRDATEAEASLIIEHSLPSSPLIIPLTAAEKGGEPTPTDPPGCVRVTPTTLNFGTVVRGSPIPESRTFNISNCGSSDLRISRLDRGSVLFFPTPANFQWTSAPLPMVIAPGAVQTVTVTFEAGRAGLQTGAIDVRTNVTGSETVRVNLRATSEPPPLSELDLKLVLNWDVSSGSDVDFHFVRNSPCNDCYYANMTPDWGVAGDITDDPFLDVDDLEGPGPENINVDELSDGTYRIWIHYYSDTGSGGGGGGGGSSTPANATVDVYIGGTLAATYGPQRLGGTGDSWDVATLEWPSGTLTPINRMFRASAGDGCR